MGGKRQVDQRDPRAACSSRAAQSPVTRARSASTTCGAEIRVRQAQLARAYGHRGGSAITTTGSADGVLNRPIEQDARQPGGRRRSASAGPASPGPVPGTDPPTTSSSPYESHARRRRRAVRRRAALLRDPRYLRVNGMPADRLPAVDLADAAATFAHWRSRALSLPGLYHLACTLAYKGAGAGTLRRGRGDRIPPRHFRLQPDRFIASTNPNDSAARSSTTPGGGGRLPPTHQRRLRTHPGRVPGLGQRARRPGRGLAFAGSTPRCTGNG